MAGGCSAGYAGDFFLFGLWVGAKTDDASNQQIPFAVCIALAFFSLPPTLLTFTIYYILLVVVEFIGKLVILCSQPHRDLYY
jgi:hypothetical protein